MKLKYSISYFVILTAMILGFIYAFAINHPYQVEGYVALEETTFEESIHSNSEDILTDGFYLKSDGEYVIVYLFDNATIFEETDILVSTLPVTLQEEIIIGKYIGTTEELYSFLENYSS